MGTKTSNKFLRRLNRWRLRKSPLKVAFLLFLWLVAIASEARASGDLKNHGGTINNTGKIKVGNQAIGLPSNIGGTVEYFGSNQSIPETNYNNLSITGSGINNTIGGKNFTVNGDLSILSTAQLNVEVGKVISLSGNIIEQGYLTGNIQKTEDLSALPSSDFGGIGATLSWSGTSPGLTTVKRTSGLALNGGGAFAVNQSIKRYYDIALSSSGFTGTFVFKYDVAHGELNSRDENTLELWRSTDGGTSWRRQGGTVNTTAHTVTKTGILSFSKWTASDATHPLGPSDIEWVAQNIGGTSGNGQNGTPNTDLGSPFVIAVTDGYGNPIANTPVAFAIAGTPSGATGQSLSVLSAITDVSGHVSTVLHLGSAAGTYTITATSGSLAPTTFTATATGVVSPPVATSMVLATGNTQVDTVGRQLANSMVVTILDQFGAPFSGATVNFAIAAKPLGDTSATLSVASATTNASGQASTKLTLGTKPGAYTVVASSASLIGASISFNSMAVTGSAYALGSSTGGGQSQVVKTTLTQPFVVSVVDVFGNPIQGASVRFAITAVPSGATGQAIADTLVRTDAQGRAQTTLTLGDSVGVYKVSAISGSLLGSPLVFTTTATSGVLPPAAQSIVLKTGNGQSATVGSQLTNPLVVTVFDQFANPFAGATVNFAIASKPSGDTTAALTILTAVTNASGQASTTLKLGTKAGSYGVTASSGSLSGSPQTFSATAVAGAPAFANLPLGTVMSGEVAAPLAQTFFVAVTDSFGNPASGVNVRFANVGSPSGATGQSPVDTTVVTDIQGQAFSRYTLGTKAGVYTIAVTTGSLAPRIITINATAGPAKSLALVSGNDQTSVVSTTLGQPMAVTATDTYGNPVGGVSVNFAITSTPYGASGQSLNLTSLATGANGQASTILTLGNKAGQYVVSATSGSLTGSPALFVATATSTGAPSMVQFTGANQAGTIKTALGQPFVVRAVDASGAPLGGISVTFAIDSIPDAASGQSLSNTIDLTDNNGFASTLLTLGDKVGVYRVSATSGGLAGSPIFFRATATLAGVPASLAVASGDRETAPVGTQLAKPMVLTVLDVNGNPVAGQPVRFKIATVPAGSSGTVLTDTVVFTNAQGQASATLTLGTKVGAYTVSASSGSLDPITFSATAVAGRAAYMLLASGDNQVGAVNAQLPQRFVVSVTDTFGNAKQGVDILFSVTSTPLGANGQTLTSVQNVTDSAGRASVLFTLGDKIGTYQVTATSAGLSGSPLVFTAKAATAGTPASIVSAAGDKGSATVGTQMPNPMVVTVLDASGNPVAGQPVRFRIATTPVGASGAVLTDTVVFTNAQGQASATLTLGTKAGSYTVTASTGSINPVTFSATAVAGRPVYVLMTSGNNQVGLVNSTLAQRFVVSVTDTFSNVKPGVVVQFGIASVPSGASGQTLTSALGVTDSTGQAFVLLTLGDKVGLYQVTATSAGLLGSPVLFSATATTRAAVKMIYAAGDKQSAQVFTQLASPLVVTVLDASGNPVSSQPVRFALGGVPVGSSGTSLSDTLVFTNAQGQATTRLTLGTKSGDYVVTASSGSLSGSPVSFTATAVAGRPVYLLLTDGSNQTGLAANTLSEPLVVAVTDTFGNAKQGVTVNYAVMSFPDSATGQMLTSASVVTNSDGEASVRLTLGSRVGLYTVSAMSGTLLGSPVIFKVTASKIIGSNQVGIVSNRLQQPFSMLVVDPSGKPLAGVSVTFAVDSIPSGATGTSFNGSTTITVMTDSTGMASAFLTLGNQTGTYRVTASSPALPSGSVIFRATAVASASLMTMIYKSGDNQSGQILTQLVSPLEVTVLDADGNPKAGQKVTFGVVSGPSGAVGQVLTPETVVTDASGRAATMVKLGSKVGVYRIAATSTGLEGSPVEFYVRATVGAALALVYVTGDSQMKLIGTTLDSAFVVRVVDVGDNPVPGVQVQFALDSIPNGVTGQRLNVLNSVTDAQGRAAAVLTFGDRAGVYRIAATLSGHVPIVFRATAVTSTGAVNLVYTSGDAQSAQILTQLANPIIVRVLDASGNPVLGQTVTFAVDSIPSGATGQLATPTVATTDASGRASAQVKLGDKVGVYKISVSSAGLSGSPVDFRVKATAGVPRTMLAVAGDGQAKQIGLTLDSAFVVRVIDQGGNPISGVAVQFSLDSNPNGATGQRLTVVNSTTDGKGQGSAILTLGTKVGAYSVTASTPVLSGTTVKFTATASSGAATAMILTSGSEQSAFILSELAAPFVVTVVDVGGNPVSGVNVQFALDSIPRTAVGQGLRIINSTTNAEGQASAILRLGNKDGRYTVLATWSNLIVGSVRFAATATVLTGDVNANSMVEIADLTTIIDHILGKIRLIGIDSMKADFNRDGHIDVADIVAMQNYLLTIQLTNSSISTLDADPSLPMNMALAAGDSTTDVKGEFVITENGLRFNLTNSIPVKGIEVIARVKPGVSLTRPDVIFDRARVDSFYYNINGNEIRIVAYNLKNVTILAGDGPLFRLPIDISDVSGIESAQLIVSKTDNAVIYDQALARTVSVRKALQGEIPASFVLYQNYPNPFNERTNIQYEVADAAGRVDVKVQVFNALGEKVKTLASGMHAGGRFTVVWDGTDDAGRKLASGAYYYRLISGTFMSAKKMIMLK